MIFQSPSAACVNLPPSLDDFVSQPFGVDAICPTTRRTSDAEKLRHCHAFGAAGLFPFFRVTEPGRASIAVKSGFNRCLRARLTSASGMSRMLGGGADSTCLGSEGGREHIKCSPGTTRAGWKQDNVRILLRSTRRPHVGGDGAFCYRTYLLSDGLF